MEAIAEHGVCLGEAPRSGLHNGDESNTHASFVIVGTYALFGVVGKIIASICITTATVLQYFSYE